MENPWGKFFLGGLAAIVTWKSINPEKQQKIIKFVDRLAIAAEHMKQERERQKQLAALLAQQLPSLPSADPARSTEEIPNEALPESVSQIQPIPYQVEPDSQWREIILPPAVVLVLGKRGSGKSALAYRLLELFRYRLSPYIVGAPARAKNILPAWIGICPSLEDLPYRSIALVDEAYLAYHARESMTQESKSMSQILNLSRQREQTLIFVSQEARQVDKNIASAASVLVFKELGMLQPEFERPELRKLVSEARDALAGKTGDKRKWAYVYSPDAGFLELLETQLPSFWKPSLSRLYGGESQQAKPRVTKPMIPSEKAKRAKGFSYTQIMNELGVSKSTVVNYLRGYPYSGKQT